MSNERSTKANRLTKVINHYWCREVVGSFPVPTSQVLKDINPKDFSNIKDGDSVWLVYLKVQTGLDKTENHFSYASSEQEAQKIVEAMPSGTIYGDKVEFPYRFKDFFAKCNIEPTAGLARLSSHGDEDSAHFKCYKALIEAGVISKGSYQTSPQVIEWLGEDSINWMRENFGENWTVVAEFEYCAHHFPRSSLACMASELFVAQFVTHDDFAAGYLTKEIEVISGGTEEIATQSAEIREKAGLAGARASRNRRTSNLETLMREIEGLADLADRISEDRIFEQAYEKAETKSEKMPKSQKSKDDYATAIRSEEPFKSRYEAVFRKNA